MVSCISENILQIRERIEKAASRSGRSPEKVSLLAVTKTRPVEDMLEACRCSIDAIAENRIQEALEKSRAWPSDVKIPWHMIGHLQGNKAGKAVGIFCCVQSVDSPSLAKVLQNKCSSAGKDLDIMVEVNIGDDPGKFGIIAKDLPFLVEMILSGCPSLGLSGFMAIPPLGLNERETRSMFAALREARDEMEGRFGRPFPDLSMGMSEDFELAVMEGSTMVRIGRAIFQNRK